MHAAGNVYRQLIPEASVVVNVERRELLDLDVGNGCLLILELST